VPEAQAQFAPRLFKLSGVPSNAGATRAAWTQMPNGAWVARSYGGLLRQEGASWKTIPPPGSDLVVQLAPYEGGLLAASANRCWVYNGTAWSEVFSGGEIVATLADGARVFVATRQEVFLIDRDRHVRPVWQRPRTEGEFTLRRIDGAIAAVDFGTGDIAVWEEGAFRLRPEIKLPAERPRLALIRGPRPHESFYSSGTAALPAGLAPPAAQRAVEALSPTWATISAEFLPDFSGALLQDYLYFPTTSGIAVHSTADGTRQWLLRPTDGEDVLQNLHPTRDGLLASGARGFYLLPDPSYVQFATIPGIIYDLISTQRGLVFLSNKGQFFADGRDAGLGFRPMLGLLELSTGEFVRAECGRIVWGDRAIDLPELNKAQVIMVELSPDRIALCQLIGAPEINGVLLIERDGRQRRLTPPATAFYAAKLHHQRGFLVYTKNGAHRYDADGQLLGSFGQGICFPALDGQQFHAMDENGTYYDETGRSLGRLPFVVLMSALTWRGDFYVLGRAKDGQHLAGRFDLKTGRFEPLDLPASRTLVELRVEGGALLVVCEGEVLRLSEPRFIQLPPPRIQVTLLDGRPVPADGLPAEERDVRLILPAARLGPWPSPSYSVRVGNGAWLSAEAGASLVLPRLDYGRKEIVVRAELAGLVAETRRIIEHHRPWWLNWPGALLASTAAVAAIFGLLRWRTRVLERRTARLERMVFVRTEQLRQANELKNQFIARLNHEIRNPINGIVGVTRMIETRARSGRDLLLVQSLRSCTEQLRGTLDDVLDLSSVEQGRVTLTEEEFDPVELVRGICQRFAQGSDVVRLVEPLPAPCWCRGDQGKIRLVLGNLLSNARKYGVPPRADVRLNLFIEGDDILRLRLAVSNPGPEISVAELARIFTPYARGSRAAETGAEGTGIGLASCRRYAEAMGGNLEADSSPGLTTFTFTVPLARLASPVENAVEEKIPGFLKILAIEDERYNRLVLGHYLKEIGVRVDWATNFLEAFALVAERRYDVILTDWSLPDMTGEEALNRFRTDLGAAMPPVVVISAHATAEMRAKILAAGAREFLSKPVSQARLRSALADLQLPGRRVASASPFSTGGPDDGELPLSLDALLEVGAPEEVLPRFARDLQQGLREATAKLDYDRSAAKSAFHAVRSLALLIGARALCGVLQDIEHGLGEDIPEEDLRELLLLLESESAWVLQELEQARTNAVEQARAITESTV
jgi:signal transduction histidine kinase/ActR/RegA family two-component response regulator